MHAGLGQILCGSWAEVIDPTGVFVDSYEFLVDTEPRPIRQNHTFGEDTSDENANKW